MRRPMFIALLLASVTALLTQSQAFAQRFRDFHGHDFRRFSFEERRLWIGGRWIHDFHAGRYGWWWVVDGIWYYYPQPIYPYPAYVSEDVIVNGPGVYPPPGGYPPPAPPPAAAPASVWYYCDNPAGYYPYIQSCAAGWRPVPSTPPGYQPKPGQP